MATGALKFFNPASILPGADVAVAPPPVADHSALGMALFDSVKQIRQTALDKRDLENLRSEANALATYFEPQSPDLAKFLRDKSDRYDLLTTDISKERAGLMTGSLGLFQAESQRIKAEKDSAAIGYENNWKTKLTGANQRYDILMRDRQRHEAEENDRINAENANRERMSRYGKTTPVPVRKPYARQAELDEAEREATRLSNMGPEDIRALATVRSGSKSIVGDGFVSGNTNTPTPDMPEEAADNGAETLVPDAPPVDGSLFPGQAPRDNSAPIPEILTAPPVAPTDNAPVNQEAPQLTEKEGPDILTKGVDPSAPLPLNQMDPINDAALQAQQSFKAYEDGAVLDVESLVDSANRSAEYYENPEALAEVVSRKDAIEAEIRNVPNKGSQAWQMQIKNILKRYTNEFTKLKQRTAVQEDAQTRARANATLKFYIPQRDANDKSKVFDVERKVMSDGTIRFFARNHVTNDMDQDVTTKIRQKDLLPLPDQDTKTLDLEVIRKDSAANSPPAQPAPAPDIAKPGTSMPDVFDYLRSKVAMDNIVKRQP